MQVENAARILLHRYNYVDEYYFFRVKSPLNASIQCAARLTRLYMHALKRNVHEIKINAFCSVIVVSGITSSGTPRGCCSGYPFLS
jgi:hypothetical protein